MSIIAHTIKIARADMKNILDSYLAERTRDSEDTGDNINDYFKLVNFSNHSLIAGYLTITFHKYKKKYSYQFSFYGFPQFKFISSMESRIKINDPLRTNY